jgi:hypothetical protein
MFNGNPFNVRCSADEDEVEGRCIKRPSCDNTVQLEIDGRCVDPQAVAAFALDELKADVFKRADGVDVPPARPYIISVSPADRFNLLWTPVDDRPQASWLRISSMSEASRTEAGGVRRVEIVIDAAKLNDGAPLIETVKFSSARAMAPNNSTVGAKITQLKINAVVVAVPSLSRSTMRLLVDEREVNTTVPVDLAPGVKLQLQVDAVDEDGLAIRRRDRTLDFIVSGLLESSKETTQWTTRVVASYVPAQSAYHAEVVLPQEDGKYQLRLHKVFGFDVLEGNGGTAATPSLARNVTLVVDSSKSRDESLKNTIIGSLCGCLFALACFAMFRLIMLNRARAKELLLSFLRWEGIIVVEVCLELFDMIGALHYSTDALLCWRDAMANVP